VIGAISSVKSGICNFLAAALILLGVPAHAVLPWPTEQKQEDAVPESNQPASEPVLDLEAALVRLGGDRELLRDLIGFFFEDSPPLLEQIERGLAAREPSVVERSAHSLKGLSSNFSAARAVQAALRLEKMGHAGNLADGATALTELHREVAALHEALALYVASHHE
jgi:HPt (histidine-containing phosphotransfer) domain-containing protein